MPNTHFLTFTCGMDSETVALLHSWMKGREDHLRTSIIPKPWNCETSDHGPRNHCRLTGGSPSLVPEWEEFMDQLRKPVYPKDISYILHQKARRFLSGTIPAEGSCLWKLLVLKL